MLMHLQKGGAVQETLWKHGPCILALQGPLEGESEQPKSELSFISLLSLLASSVNAQSL